MVNVLKSLERSFDPERKIKRMKRAGIAAITLCALWVGIKGYDAYKIKESYTWMSTNKAKVVMLRCEEDGGAATAIVLGNTIGVECTYVKSINVKKVPSQLIRK